MSGKRVSPVMYYSALLLLVLNCGGIFYLNKVYKLSISNIIILFSLQIVLLILNFIFLKHGRVVSVAENELLAVCDIDDDLEFSEKSSFELIKDKIILYRKNAENAADSEKHSLEASGKLKEELQSITAAINSRKESAAELKILRKQINDLASTIKDLESYYQNYNSTIIGIAENQTESAEHLNSIIGHLLESIDKEALIASKAEEISSKMTDTVISGGDDISKTIALISAVEQLSGQISEIIGVIDNITELTNLLAMNAAIEAAHAGDAGKGFAVVAGEIQKLSKETSKSSGKISELVRNVAFTIKDMTSNAENASDGLKAIMDSVHRTEDIVKDITGAIMQQSEEGNKVLSASNSIIKSADKIKADKDNNTDLIKKFPEIIERIEGFSESMEVGVESIINDLGDSEIKIQKLISSL